MYFFEPKSKQRQLKAILDSWLGTPFRHHCGVKGLGADCIHFVARTLEEAGALVWDRNMIPDYPPDWHMHNTGERLLDGIIAKLDVERIDYTSPRAGDIILFRFGKASSHAAIYHSGHIYQAINGIGVQRVSWADKKWHRRKTHGLRIRG